MAKKFRRFLAIVLVMAMVLAQTSFTVSAQGPKEKGTEYIQISVNGAVVKTISGTEGDHTWLVQGTYTYNLDFNKETRLLTYTIGKQSGTYTVPMPAGYENYGIGQIEMNCTFNEEDSTNSQSSSFDNAKIEITIKTVVDPGTGDEIEVTDPKDPDPVDYAPVLNVVKTADKATYLEGETVTWTITVTNTSEYTAYDVEIVDEFTNDSWNIEELIPGASATYTATTENAPAGTLTNVVVVTWTDGDEIDDTEEPEEPKTTSDDETVIIEEPDPVDYAPVLNVVKTADKATYLEGETITWTITVTNISEYTAYDVEIVDEFTGDSWSIDELIPGASATYTATTENAHVGTLTNVVVVTWTDGDEIDDENEPEEPKTTSDDETVIVEEPAPVDYEPVLSVVKTADKAVYLEGETITWTITVINISKYTAYDVAIADEFTGDSWSIAELAPGASATYTATTENAPAGTLKNVVVVTWTDGDEIDDENEPEEPKSTTDDETVIVNEPEPTEPETEPSEPDPVDYEPKLTVVKTADKETYLEGETITWTITVANISKYTAYDVEIVDALTGDSWSIDELAPGASKSFTAITENAPAGEIKNVVVTTWTDGDEIDDEDEPEEPKTTSDDETVIVEEPEPVDYEPELSVVKIADKETYLEGETITWTITVANISKYTAYGVEIVDELTGDSWSIDELAPGASKSFTAITENAPAGEIKNVVVTTWTDGDEIDDENEPEEPKTVIEEETVTVNEPEPAPAPAPVVEPEEVVEEPVHVPAPVLEDEVEILDEDVPLADAPKTGDISILWAALSLLSAGGIFGLNKKRDED